MMTKEDLENKFKKMNKQRNNKNTLTSGDTASPITSFTPAPSPTSDKAKSYKKSKVNLLEDTTVLISKEISPEKMKTVRRELL